VSLLNLFKLEKLKIEAYTDEGRKTPADPASMEVTFNPTTYKRTHAIAYESAKRQAINTPGKPARYAYTPPADISFQFILDGTGVDNIGLVQLGQALGGQSVKKDIAKFEKLCLKMNGNIHEPNFLLIRWGDFTFSGRLKTLDITYKLFDEAGDPIRAELAVAFVEDKSAETIFREAGKASPDLTHIRVVKSGDTLPLLCKEIYGSSGHYIRVAADNGLDQFRNLVPGQKLVFAPLKAGGEPSGT
jgi:Contractile injection system tube protein